MLVQTIREQAFALAGYMADLRHRLHQIPEAGFQEFKTQQLITEELSRWDIPYQCERTWVIGLISGAHPGPTVAFRADMDGLPIAEETGAAFASTHPGYMHACGHDLHVAGLLGTARLLQGMRESLRGNVKLLFQPAEETVGGALPMIQAGCMENPHVDVVYGLHSHGALPVGQMGCRAGAAAAASDELRLTVRGKAGHGAHPEGCVDAIVIAGQMIGALQTLVSRNVAPGDPAVLSLGSIHGGSAHNVICDEVVLRGTLRTVEPATRERMKARITAVAEGTAAMLGGSAIVEFLPGYCALHNHAAPVERVAKTARLLFGPDAFVAPEGPPGMGVEDYAYFLLEAPGAYFGLGAKPEGPAWPGHHPRYLPDERALPYGAALFAALALSEMGLLDETA